MVSIEDEQVVITNHIRDINNMVNKIKTPEQLIYTDNAIGRMVEQYVKDTVVNPTRVFGRTEPPSQTYNRSAVLSIKELIQSGTVTHTESNGTYIAAGHEKQFIQDISKDTTIGKLYPAKDFAVNDPAIRVFSPEANLIRKNLSINPSDMKNAPQGQYMKAMNHYPPLYEKDGLIHVPCARDDDKTGFPAKEELILTKRQTAALIDFSLKYEKAQCADKVNPVFAKRDVMSEEHNKLLASVFPGTTREQRQEKYTALYRSLEAEVTAMNREAGFMRKPEISQAKKETPVQQKAVKPKSRDDGFER